MVIMCDWAVAPDLAKSKAEDELRHCPSKNSYLRIAAARHTPSCSCITSALFLGTRLVIGTLLTEVF